MTNSQTSLRLNKRQSEKVAYIVKENGQYEVGTEVGYALFNQKMFATYSTLKEVAIQNIIPFLTTQEQNYYQKQQKIRSLKADYSIAKSMNDTEWMKECKKELENLETDI